MTRSFMFALPMSLLMAGAALAEAPAERPSASTENKAITLERMQEKRAKMFERMDADGDGSISREEYMARGEAMFSRVDRDGDGRLTRDEMRQGRKGHGGKHEGMRDGSGGDRSGGRT